MSRIINTVDSEGKGALWTQGYKAALHDIEKEIDYAAINQYKFPILHIRDFIDRRLGKK